MNAAAEDDTTQSWESLAQWDARWDDSNRAARAQRRRRTAAVKLAAVAVWTTASVALANHLGGATTWSEYVWHVFVASGLVVAALLVGGMVLVCVGWVIYQILVVLGVVD